MATLRSKPTKSAAIRGMSDQANFQGVLVFRNGSRENFNYSKKSSIADKTMTDPQYIKPDLTDMPQEVVGASQHDDTRKLSENTKLSPMLDVQLWSLACIVFGFLAVMKGLRLPSLWSMTQMQINYDFGFVKRGLFGELLSFFGHNAHNYVFLAIISYIILILTLVSLFVLSKINVGFSPEDQGISTALFCSSYALTYLVHMVGYLDIFLLFLTILALLTNRMKLLALPAIFVISFISLCIHEMFLLVFFPIMLLPLLITAFQANVFLRQLTTCGILTSGVLALAILLSWSKPLDVQQIAVMRDVIVEQVDFPVRQDFFKVLERTTIDNLKIMLGLYRSQGWWVGELLAGSAFLPTAGLFLWLSLRIVVQFHDGAGRRLIYTSVCLASIAPAAMQLLGWDIYRWYALVVLNSFLALNVVCACYLVPPCERLEVGSRTRSFVIILITINIATNVGFFDQYGVVGFPFWEHIVGMKDLILNRWSFPQY